MSLARELPREATVVVQETEKGSLVSFADPKAMFELVPDASIEDVATEARRLLENAKDQL